MDRIVLQKERSGSFVRRFWCGVRLHLTGGKSWKRCPGCVESLMMFPRWARWEGRIFFFFSSCSPTVRYFLFPVWCCGCSQPRSDGCAQHRLSDSSVEFNRQLIWQASSVAPESHLRLCLFEDGADTIFPLRILRDDAPQKLEGSHGVASLD